MTGLNFGRSITNPDFNGALVFGEMSNAFERAYQSSASTQWESDCAFAGQRVQIRIAGSALVNKMMGTFKHLRVKDGGNVSSELKIDLWHEVETAVACPADLIDLRTKSLWTSWEGEYGVTMGSPNDRYIACQRPSTLTCFDRQARHIVGWVGDHERLSLYETGKPLHLPLLLWHHDQNAPVAHAGLVSKNGRGALLVGKGGSGKSTCALACLRSDFLYVGDDYIGLKILDDGTYEGYGIYNSTWLSRDNLPRFPELAQHAIIAARPDEQKNLVLLSEVFPERLAASAPIHAVILPRIVGHGPSRAIPVGKSKALLAVAPSSIILLPSAGTRSLIKLATLLERVPCYVLEVGGNIRSIPEQIDKLLDSIN